MDARAVDLAIFKKNSDPHIDKICGGGSRAMGLDLDPTLKCQIISIYCPSDPSLLT